MHSIERERENALLRAMLEAKRLSGLTQKEIAGRIGMPQSNVSRIEHSASVSSNVFAAYIAACGFDFKIELQPADGNGVNRATIASR